MLPESPELRYSAFSQEPAAQVVATEQRNPGPNVFRDTDILIHQMNSRIVSLS